jgi:fatty-acid peroxygenase
MTDLALRLLHDGYGAIERDRAARGATGTYATRLLGRRTVVLTGASGARLFYDEDVMRRTGAIPPPLAWLLFGRGAVHALDGPDHRERKQLFLDAVDDPGAARVADVAADNLRAELAGAGSRPVAVHPMLVRSYGDAVLRWAGVDVDRAAADTLSARYAAIVDGFGFAGRAYLRAWRERRRTDAWASSLVTAVRTGRVTPRPGTPLAAVAATDLPPRVAAVELGNMIRPTIAVSWLGTFAVAALATATTAEQRRRLARSHDARTPGGDADAALLWSFAEEVRRTSPFVPALAARAVREVQHGGVRIREGDQVVLDVPGIDHDPDVYAEPQAFVADRFTSWHPGPFALVPQGGGYPTGHRCPGESITLRLVAATTQVLAEVDHRVVGPRAADLRRIPTLPAGGLVIEVGRRLTSA